MTAAKIIIALFGSILVAIVPVVARAIHASRVNRTGVVGILAVGGEIKPHSSSSQISQKTPQTKGGIVQPKRTQGAHQVGFPAPPLPIPPTSCKKMTDRQLNHWARTLKMEQQQYVKLCKHLSSAAVGMASKKGRVPEALVVRVPSRIKEYLKKVMGRPIDKGDFSGEEYAKMTAALTAASLQLGDRLDEALEETLERGFSN